MTGKFILMHFYASSEFNKFIMAKIPINGVNTRFFMLW